MSNNLNNIYANLSGISSIGLVGDIIKEILGENKSALRNNENKIKNNPEKYGKIEDYNEIITKIKNEIEKLEK